MLRDELQHALGSAYTLERELDGAGMSHVFVAYENALGRRVVVKVLPQELVAGVSVERFNREILLAARLQHPHIVPVHSAGEMDGVPYYTMPFVEGESLRARLVRTPMLPISEAIGVLRDVAKALAYAHERSIVHRDIKPDNVLLSGGSATVTDFGIAKAIAAARTGAVDGQQFGLTQVGTSIGTPMYMAPEQAAGDPSSDSRADIYSFGCMAYEMLAGRPPFVAKTAQKLLAMHMGESPADLRTLRPDVPEPLAQLVMQCLAKDAGHRPRRASDIVQLLETVTGGAGHPTMPAILLGGRTMMRKALIAYAAAFVVVALVAKAAVATIGLPDWVFPGALFVMALGLPVMLFTAFVHYTARHAVTMTPTFTPGGTASAVHGPMATIALKASPHVSWRRSAIGGALALGGFVVLVGIYMVLRHFGIGPAGSLFGAGTLAADDRVLVADFTVMREDSALAPILVEAVRASMGQSRAIRLIEPEQVGSTLTQMRRTDSARLDAKLWREVAMRTGAKAILGGRVARAGSAYVISLELTATQGGTRLASYPATANDAKELISVIDGLTRKLRGRIGESLKQVQRSIPLEQATTSSLDALRKYSEGVHANDVDNDFPHAVRALREAVAIDSTFALAWRKLGVALGNGNYSIVARDSAYTRAFHYAERLPDRERYVVLGTYYNSVARDRRKALAAYQAAYVADSGFNATLNQLMNVHLALRQYDSAARYAANLIEIQPIASSAGYLARTLALAGRVTDSRRLIDSVLRADSTGARNNRILDALFHSMYGAGQRDSARVVAESMARGGGRRTRVLGLRFLQYDASTRGELRRATDLLASSDSMNAALGDDAAGGRSTLAYAALQKATFLGHHAEAARELDSAATAPAFTRAPPELRPYLSFALAYARANQPAKSEEMLARYERDVRRSQTPMGNSDVLWYRGEIAIARGDGRGAVDLFRRTEMVADGGPSTCEACTIGGLARAFDLAGERDSAAMYYERYLAIPAARRWDVDGDALARIELRLGELYEAKSDWQRAAAHYGAFVELWKHADAPLQPKVAEVKARLERVRKRAG